MPHWINSGSSPNIRIQVSGKEPTKKNIIILIPRAIAAPVYIVCDARLYSPAPMFCALIAEIDVLIATPGSIAKPLSFPTAPTAADAITPIEFTNVVKNKNESPDATFCIEVGMPTFSISDNCFLENALKDSMLKSKIKLFLAK